MPPAPREPLEGEKRRPAAYPIGKPIQTRTPHHLPRHLTPTHPRNPLHPRFPILHPTTNLLAEAPADEGPDTLSVEEPPELELEASKHNSPAEELHGSGTE